MIGAGGREVALGPFEYHMKPLLASSSSATHEWFFCIVKCPLAVVRCALNFFRCPLIGTSKQVLRTAPTTNGHLRAIRTAKKYLAIWSSALPQPFHAETQANRKEANQRQ
jgi:hypothetical protein